MRKGNDERAWKIDVNFYHQLFCSENGSAAWLHYQVFFLLGILARLLKALL